MVTSKTKIKVVGTFLLSLADVCFGELNNLFKLLLILMLCDIILGISCACYTKTLSSRKMRDGIYRKIGIFVVIAIAVRVDFVILEALPEGIIIADHKITVRALFLAYFCICECLSCFENLHILGVPIPKSIETVLKKALNTATDEESPKKLFGYISDFFKALQGNKHKVEELTLAKEEIRRVKATKINVEASENADKPPNSKEGNENNENNGCIITIKNKLPEEMTEITREDVE